MGRKLLLILAVCVSAALFISSVRRILSFHDTSKRVLNEEAKLLQLKQKNEELKKELEYKKSERFAEEEIRNKLGLAKEGEEVYVVPREQDAESLEIEKPDLPNWRKWQILIFGRG